MAQALDLRTIARETPRFSGADLANLTNEAAILAASESKDEIGILEFDEAIDRVITGPVRKSRKVSKRERKIVAYHEAGHTLVAYQLSDADPVPKVTIAARGVAGRHTRLLPNEDRDLWSKAQFEAMLAMMMAGQASETAIFNDVTTGSSNDLQNATDVAWKMVAEYGMSEELEPQTFDSGQDLIFLGKELALRHNYNDAVAQKIDAEVKPLLGRARDTAKCPIELNQSKLKHLVDRILADETVQGPALEEFLTSTASDTPVAA